MQTIQTDFDSLKPEERFRVLNWFVGYVLTPPISIEKLTEDQLEELFEHVKIKFSHDEDKTNESTKTDDEAAA